MESISEQIKKEAAEYAIRNNKAPEWEYLRKYSEQDFLAGASFRESLAGKEGGGDAVGFADFIKEDYSPIEDNSGWILNGNNYKKGDMPDITVYTTKELFNKYLSESPMKSEGAGWVRVTDKLPEDGIEVIGYSEKWIHLDFNPNGTRVCFISNGEEWSSAKWNDAQDSWHTHAEWCCKETGGTDFAPTHWQPLPPAPKE